MTELRSADWTDALIRARNHAPFLARALDRQPELAALLEAGDAEGAFVWARLQEKNEDLAVGLRRHRLALATTIAIGDLAGAFLLPKVVTELSDFADHALDVAIKTAIEERTGEATARGLFALALGKQGSHELNYSSDIDPIILYDPATLPHRATEDPGEAAQRYVRKILKLLSDTTAEGYVQRVDLRLRPASEISPLAVHRDTALSHYQGQALAWERAAFIRARSAAGDIAAGEAFLDEIAPFVWRQTLDFGAVEEIRELTLRIRESYDGPVAPGPGFDVKRGRGGIREIEFFAQTHQLIHGGRDPTLRVRATREALNALAKAGQIEAEEAQILGEGYDRLRTIEHRLQMVNDRQTHTLPEGEWLDNVARLDGLPDGDALVLELSDLTELTGGIYESLIGDQSASSRSTSNAGSKKGWSAKLGFENDGTLQARIEEWRDGRYACLRSPQAVEAFDRLLPALLNAFVSSDDPERAFTRWQRILESAPSAITLFRLLDAHHELLDRLVAALTLSPILADQLARRPERLDVLIDKQPLAPPLSVGEIEERMTQSAVRDDYESRLDAIRRETGEARFMLGLRLIEAENPPSEVARVLSNVAEAGIRVAVKAASDEFARVHGQISSGDLIVLGLGRLGGGVLTHASDLDIVYLFTGDFSAQSDGGRPLGATLYFNRLASRVSAALSVPTAQGALYEVDTRLRPQGNQGPLAVSVEAFAKYQSESAWTWEHMALARARPLVGSKPARAQVNSIIANVLGQERDPDRLRSDVLKMRSEMAQHKSPRGPLDVKLQRGGLVDIEFLVHFLQLRDGAELLKLEPAALSSNLDRAISSLGAQGKLCPQLADAHRLMTDLLVAGRLLAPDGKAPSPAAAAALAKACGTAGYAELSEALAVARKSVIQCWADVFSQRLELD